MNNSIKKIYYEMVSTAANYVKASASQHLPESTQKSFMLWILSDGSPYQEDYLRMMGVAGSIELELSLLETVVDLATIQKLSHYIGLLNAYFAFETLSDNIGVGLSTASRDKNNTYELQRKTLSIFNDAMISKLQGDIKPTIELLAPCIELTKHISAYEKCLAPSQMHQFAKEYLKHYPNDSLIELEHSFFSILVLNIETCLDLLNSLRNHPIYSILKDSLIARYSAVNALIKSDNALSLATSADLGTKSILVMPTLAFCIGALDTILPNSQLTKTIKDNSLSKSLYSASLLVRLLNDIGTTLFALNDKEQTEFFKKLESRLQQQKFKSIFEFLVTTSETEEFFYLLTRIRKDLKQGEFNICLDHLPYDNTLNALNEFSTRVTFYSNLYKENERILHEFYSKLAKDLSDTKIGQVIVNFVAFHQKMYSKEFETKYGDYAITNSSLNK